MEYNKRHLENIYENICNKKIYQGNYISIVQKLDKEIQVETLEYRIASVLRILDYIHTNLSIKKDIDLAILITHCCNKLNGNLDGIELDLEKEK